MLLTISDVIDTANLNDIREKLSSISWRDGRSTAGKTARDVKRNEQADLSSPAGQKLQSSILSAISKNPILRAAARPKVISNLLISRTANGGYYGAHIDNALMQKGSTPFRSDLSFTLFLSPPNDYDDGELVIHSAGTSNEIKADAGDLLLYPSSSVHEVSPVTRGERIVCVGWIESVISDGGQRELLFDLENLRASLRKSLPAQSAELMTLDKTMSNLLRMWAKP